jgi:hypothetical protein
VVIVTGDHGFQDVRAMALPNVILARAGLRACPRAGEGWRATAHISGGAAAVFVSPPGDAGAAAAAEQALRREANATFSVLTRRELDELGADLVEATSAWLDGLARVRQVAFDDRELPADLLGARVGLLRGADHRGTEQHPIRGDERRFGVCRLLGDRFLQTLREVDVLQDGRNEAAHRRVRVDDGQQRSLAGQGEGRGTAALSFLEMPAWFEGVIVSTELLKLREHRDIRIARRAATLASLAQIISERQVQKGLRTVLWTQARRLEWLVFKRLEELGHLPDDEKTESEEESD